MDELSEVHNIQTDHQAIPEGSLLPSNTLTILLGIAVIIIVIQLIARYYKK